MNNEQLRPEKGAPKTEQQKAEVSQQEQELSLQDLENVAGGRRGRGPLS